MPEAPELGNVAASDFRASPAADKVGGGRCPGEFTHSFWTRHAGRQEFTHSLTPPPCLTCSTNRKHCSQLDQICFKMFPQISFSAIKVFPYQIRGSVFWNLLIDVNQKAVP